MASARKGVGSYELPDDVAAQWGIAEEWTGAWLTAKVLRRMINMGMSEPEIVSGLTEIINEDTGLPFEVIKLGSRFGTDLAIDAAMMQKIVADIYARFDVPVPNSAAAEFESVGDAVAYIQAEIG